MFAKGLRQTLLFKCLNSENLSVSLNASKLFKIFMLSNSFSSNSVPISEIFSLIFLVAFFLLS